MNPSNGMTREQWREHRRRRFRRHGRRAYIRSVYSLPSLATLGNAVCGFGSLYVSGLGPLSKEQVGSLDPITQFCWLHAFAVSAYLIFLAMFFDGIDGRLARFARHTTDFGGQLDSLADVISFGCAPAFLALQLFRDSQQVAVPVSRLIWAVAALYMCCAAIRLARFNVSNEHGEQHHYSFLGLPSPGAGATVAAFVLLQQSLHHDGLPKLSYIAIWVLPGIVLATGLLMVSTFRYPHLVNKYLRGKRSIWRLLLALAIGLAMLVAHRYVLGLASLGYVVWTPLAAAFLRMRPKPQESRAVA